MVNSGTLKSANIFNKALSCLDATMVYFATSQITVTMVSTQFSPFVHILFHSKLSKSSFVAASNLINTENSTASLGICFFGVMKHNTMCFQVTLTFKFTQRITRMTHSGTMETTPNEIIEKNVHAWPTNPLRWRWTQPNLCWRHRLPQGCKCSHSVLFSILKVCATTPFLWDLLTVKVAQILIFCLLSCLQHISFRNWLFMCCLIYSIPWQVLL